MPDSLKILAASVIRARLINNREFIAQYNELIEAESFSEELQKQRQLNDVKQALVYAYNNTKYYKKIFDKAGFDPEKFSDFSDLKVIPIMTKDDLRNNLEDILVNKCKDYYQTTTGGTTGEPVPIYLDKASIYREMAFVYYFWSKFGYNYKKSRLATFRGLDFHGKISKANPLYNEIVLNPFCLNPDNVNLYLNKIDMFSPEFLRGYPSAIAHFCQCMQHKGLSPKKPIKAVFLISENVYPFQVELIESTLGCKCHSFYGHSERAVFAEEIEDGTYIPQKLYGYMELDGETDGKILCTGFINKKMPLVRYDTGDYGVRRKTSTEIEGHHYGEMLIGKNGEMISAAAINFHTKVMDGVEGYQFIQNIPGQADLIIVPKRKLSDLEISEITNVVQEKIGDALKVTTKTSEHFILTTRGKYRMVIQNISGGGIDKVSFMIVGHRTSELLYGNHGEQYSAAAINFHSEEMKFLEGYQFIQSEKGKAVLNIMCTPGMKVDYNKVKQTVLEKLGSKFILEVKEVEHFQLTERGKFKIVIHQ